MSFCTSCGHYSWPGLLSPNEMLAFVRDEKLPDNFKERCESYVGLFTDCTETCPNCDNSRCMHFRLRDWWGPDFDSCDGWCCPDCRDFKGLIAENPDRQEEVA